MARGSRWEMQPTVPSGKQAVGGEGTAGEPEVRSRGRLDSAAFSDSLQACEVAGPGQGSYCTKGTG